MKTMEEEASRGARLMDSSVVQVNEIAHRHKSSLW